MRRTIMLVVAALALAGCGGEGLSEDEQQLVAAYRASFSMMTAQEQRAWCDVVAGRHDEVVRRALGPDVSDIAVTVAAARERVACAALRSPR